MLLLFRADPGAPQPLSSWKTQLPPRAPLTIKCTTLCQFPFKKKQHWPFDANSRWMVSICSGPGFAGVSAQNSWHLVAAHSAAFPHQLRPRWVQMCSHLCLPFPTIAIVEAKPAPPCQKCVLCAAARYYTVIKYLLDSELRKASCCAAPFSGTSGRL